MTAQPDAVARGKHDKDQRRRCLIDAATHLFAEKGYDAATTREVAQRAGCSEGLIHRYFCGKHGLLLAILDAKAGRMMDSSAELLPAKRDLAEEIEQMLTVPLDEFWNEREFMRVSVSLAAIDPVVGKLIGDRVNGSRVAFMAERLRWHQQAGRIRPDVDISCVALAISGLNIAQGFFAPVAFGMDRGEISRCVRTTAEVIVRGIRAGNGNGSSA
jgi:AcrR family transcriptional regulator